VFLLYKNKKIVAIIPARKGSKGILNKNIRKINGIPLVLYSILQAKKSLLIDKIIVSTDSEKICQIAKKQNIEILSLRPPILSTDDAILYDVIKYEILNYQLVENGFDIIILLQPTSPMRPLSLIDNSVKEFIDGKQKSAVSVSEVAEHPIFMRSIENNYLIPIIKFNSTIRRQDLPKFYKINGIIYINYIFDILQGFVSFNDNLSPIIIPNEYNIEIDEEKDLKLIKQRMFELNKKGQYFI
jgi:CMP-N,N'-diacetyllegionaminic acid synthase